MKALYQKHIRGNLQQSIRSALKKQYPHFQMEQSLRKIPIYPKIVVYSTVASVDKFLEQILPTYKIQRPKPSVESDQILARRIATEIVYPSAQQQNTANGIALQGFPFNTTQALLLDRFLNGVNLAIHIKGEESNPEFESLLKYYDERGTLLEFNYIENPSVQQIEAIHTEITSSIKLTEF